MSYMFSKLWCNSCSSNVCHSANLSESPVFHNTKPRLKACWSHKHPTRKVIARSPWRKTSNETIGSGGLQVGSSGWNFCLDWSQPHDLLIQVPLWVFMRGKCMSKPISSSTREGFPISIYIPRNQKMRASLRRRPNHLAPSEFFTRVQPNDVLIHIQPHWMLIAKPAVKKTWQQTNAQFANP